MVVHSRPRDEALAAEEAKVGVGAGTQEIETDKTEVTGGAMRVERMVERVAEIETDKTEINGGAMRIERMVGRVAEIETSPLVAAVVVTIVKTDTEGKTGEGRRSTETIEAHRKEPLQGRRGRRACIRIVELEMMNIHRELVVDLTG